MKTIPAGEFKARCLKVMDEVQLRSEPVVVTKRGKPVVKVMPVEPATGELFGFLAGQFEIVGDIVAPVVGDWEYD
jgi:prevent-host-death family protein